jgi:hypothetical protein
MCPVVRELTLHGCVSKYKTVESKIKISERKEVRIVFRRVLQRVVS